MKKTAYLLLPLALLFGACAKNVTTSDNALNKEFYEKWIAQAIRDEEYPDARTEPFGNGIYILEETAGTGREYSGEDFVWVDYTVSDLAGNISFTTDEQTARRLMIWDAGDYYGPRPWSVYPTTITVGLQDILTGMRVGGRRKVLVPSWLMTYDRYGSAAEYLNHSPSGAATAVYDLSLADFTANMTAHQIKEMEDYGKATYAKADSLQYGFYYYPIKKDESAVAFSSTAKVKIDYIGRRMDGSVFDTSVERVAKDNGLWDESKTYGPTTIQWGEEYTALTMSVAGSSESVTPITGFQLALWQMRSGSQGEAVFFSNLGYGASGHGNAIPGYSPLRFEITVVGVED